MQRTRLAAFARAISSFVCLTAAVSLFSVRANSQSDCEAAAELTFVCQKLAASPSTDNLEDLLQRSIHVTDQCPSHGDAWYLRALIEQRLGKVNAYAMQKAQRLNSPALKRSASPCETLAGNPSPPPAGNRDTTPPHIEILSPPITRGQKVTQIKSCVAAIEGRVTDSESPIGEVTVNGAPVNLDGQGRFKLELKLAAGENPIYVAARDAQGNPAREDFKIACETSAGPPVIASASPAPSPASPAVSDGKYYALIIAVEKYQDANVTTLSYPVSDGRNVRRIITEHYSFDLDNVELLENPNRQAVISNLTKLTKKLRLQDRLLIFYAGHGYWNERRQQGYWLPSNSEKEDVSNWISNSDLREAINEIKAMHILVITDACFSGALFVSREAFTKSGTIEEMEKLQSRTAMTSGALTTVPDRSVFVKYLLEYLEKNTDAYLLASDLFSRIRTPVINNSPKQADGNRPTPRYGTIQEADDRGGDFIFERRRKK